VAELAVPLAKFSALAEGGFLLFKNRHRVATTLKSVIEAGRSA
jgi:hypothetical protein